MMNSLIKLNNFETLSSRECGAAARVQLVQAMQASDSKVVLDFNLKSMSPSFADECLGILVKSVGLNVFKTRIELKNVTPSTKALIKHVIHKRLSAKAELPEAEVA
ncbi:STAS-like domain-containing protein [Pseudidiomarina sp. 1APP75-32.1]|uniref:STAS-like domain-containing protein n=1 Tax=Pseudidiomarina terrestris TaxID=2820060 RepID=A0AAW7R266_9GAMM|nr:STAS-like domain-containing protein [Pseudidiomarina sp. 1APP75-32.1]MDN7125057.1 STAS-like domain-containing protein [Pseudidiomarina sp. 1APP75-32.1]